MKYKSVKTEFKEGQKVLTQDSFGRSYIGTVTECKAVYLKALKKWITEIYIQDSKGQVIPRNIKHVKHL